MVKPLRERLVLAVIEALDDGDPRVTIGLADDEVRVCWQTGEAESRYESAHDTNRQQITGRVQRESR